MVVFGNRHLEEILAGTSEIPKPSRRIRKLRKKALAFGRVF